MKVAFTSSTGAEVDEHFGAARKLSIWEISPDTATFVTEVQAGSADDDEEDRIAARAEAIKECAMVYTVEIGGPAAAKLVARKIHPIKTGKIVPVPQLVETLQKVLRGNPPPWLKKALAGKRGSFLAK